MTTSLKQRATEAMPGGVNSPVRAFKSVGGDPLFACRGRGPILETVDGRRLIDFCMSFGPLILGHAHAEVVAAIAESAVKGTSFAVTTEAEIEMAELVKEAFPAMERVRLVNSGTEACMTALRLVRGYTGRSKILKFSGNYHGHSDGLLVEAGSGVAGLATASSAGVPESLARNTLVVPYNDRERTIQAVREHGADLAAIVVEPVAANMGLVIPQPGFIELLRTLCYASGALLVFDEVITGFRLTFGGYQSICGITPDLTCLGKIIGGGLPIGAVGGLADIMDLLAPSGPVYQAGTLSGNPVSVAAGLATLRHLKTHHPYSCLDELATGFTERIAQSAARHGIALSIPQMGSLFSFFFTREPVQSFEDAMACDRDSFVKMFHGLLKRGVYLPPSAFETSFLSIQHDAEVLDQAFAAFDQTFAEDF